jgi:hypothetical protein
VTFFLKFKPVKGGNWFWGAITLHRMSGRACLGR